MSEMPLYLDILKLTCWVFSTNSLTLEPKRARSHQTDETKYTASQKFYPKSTAPDSQRLKSTGWPGTTLPGNLVPKINQLTLGITV